MRADVNLGQLMRAWEYCTRDEPFRVREIVVELIKYPMRQALAHAEVLVWCSSGRGSRWGGLTFASMKALWVDYLPGR